MTIPTLQPQSPQRVLGFLAAASVVVGMVVGAGIFRSASVVAANLPSEWLILAAWAAGGVFALAGAFCYAELATAFPSPGGDYRFLREAFGRDVAYIFAWSRFAIVFTASGAMLAFVATDYLAEIVPLGPLARAGIAALLIIALTALNLRGVRTGTRSETALVAIDITALLALGGAALWLVFTGVEPQSAGAPAAGVGGSFGVALVFVMLAYGGFNDAAALSAEVRRPRDMTRALVGGMAAVTALYLLANWAYLRGLGHAGLARSEAPAAALAGVAFGPVGASVMVAMVALAAVAILNALVIVGGRTLYAAAADEPALARLAEWDGRRGVPRAAVWAQCLVSLALVGWGASARDGFVTMVDYMAPVYWLFLTLTGLALMRLRSTAASVPRPYRVPLYPLVPLLFLGGSGFVLAASVEYVGLAGSAISFGVMLAGFGVRAVFRAVHGRAVPQA